jgi:hypothetical protein
MRVLTPQPEQWSTQPNPTAEALALHNIFEIASQISTPLALSGFLSAVLFFLFRQIINKDIFPRLTSALGGSLLKVIVDRLFILALVAMILGFAGYVAPKIFPGQVVDHLPKPNAGANSQVNQVQQSTSGAGSPTVQGVKGDVSITVDQSSPPSDASSNAPKPAKKKAGEQTKN